MVEIITVGLDIAKSVFQVHGVDAAGEVALRRQLRRVEVLKFFRNLPPCLVGMEACGTAHYWARALRALGHDARLLPPAHVKPYVKRGKKNDAADAAAICEAVSRPHMQLVPIKSAESQGALMLHRVRDLLVGHRRARQQDGAYRLGRALPRRSLPRDGSSGRLIKLCPLTKLYQGALRLRG
jgi:transposase